MSSTLTNLMNGRQNNFDIIRFVAATLVMVTHSYALSMGIEHERTYDPLMLLTDGQSTLGHLAVLIFFITSGFLITQSFDRTKDPIYFLQSRLLRIFPALIVVILLTVFVLGPIVTEYTLNNYFTSLETYEYFMSLLLWPMKYYLPGVFEQNAYAGAVNGSLWTLYHEFASYLIVCTIGMTGLLNKKLISLYIFGIVYTLSLLSIPKIDGILNLELFSAFAAGGMFYLFREKIPFNGKLAGLSFIVIVLASFTNYFIAIFTLFGTYFVLYLAYTPRIKLNHFGKYGDFSYGIYIYGFPIQQTVTYYFGGQMRENVNFLIAYPITLVFAIVSWHFIEKKALSLKGTIRRKEPTIDVTRSLWKYPNSK